MLLSCHRGLLAPFRLLALGSPTQLTPVGMLASVDFGGFLAASLALAGGADQQIAVDGAVVFRLPSHLVHIHDDSSKKARPAFTKGTCTLRARAQGGMLIRFS